MKTYTIIRDIIFFILWLAILWVGVYTAKMTDVIDSNLIYVNRKVPPIAEWKRPSMDKWQEQYWDFEIPTPNPNNVDPIWVESKVWLDAILH